MRVLFLLAALAATPAAAINSIAGACLASSRSPGVEACRCAENVARKTLLPGDAPHAVGIIRDPDLYIAYKAHRSARVAAFLDRYDAWGTVTELACR